MEEVGSLDDALAFFRLENDLAAQRHQAQRQLGAGVGVSHRTADGAAIARLEVTDPGHRQCQQRNLVHQGRTRQQLRLAYPSAYRQAILAQFDIGQLSHMIDIDQQLGLSQAHVQHRHQRLATGNDASVLAVLGEQLNHLTTGVSPNVIESSRFHCAPPLPNSAPSEARSRAHQPVEMAWPLTRCDRRVKICPMITFEAPCNIRPPTAATLPLTATWYWYSRRVWPFSSSTKRTLA
ncbi:hypothetical protein D9M71_597820 [compost metagenome]